ncbi:MAG: hypothetical protein ACQETB_07350, partial [Halobacteriota archaeon]
AVPMFFAGEIRERDVILFEAQELGGGELTTHRVDAVTDAGYVTKGDANPFTDQDGAEPIVSDGQVRSVALQINGELVVIPGLGSAVGVVGSTTQSAQDRLLSPFGIDSPDSTAFSTAVLVLGLLLLIYSILTGSTDTRTRSRSNGSILQNAIVVVAILTLVVVVPANFSMLLPSGTYQYEIISSTSPTDQEQVIQAGESSDVTYYMQNSGHLPVVVFLQPASSGVEIAQSAHFVPRRTTVTTTVTMHAPAETGAYLRFVQESRYLVVLPPSLIASLHAIHPLAALAAINVAIVTVVVAIAIGSLGTDRIRFRSRSRGLSAREQLVRTLPVVGSARPAPPDRSEAYAAIDGHKYPFERAGSRRLDPVCDLSARQRLELGFALTQPPDAIGVEAERWTPTALRSHLEKSYGVTCSLADCVRVLERHGEHPDPDWSADDRDAIDGVATAGAATDVSATDGAATDVSATDGAATDV